VRREMSLFMRSMPQLSHIFRFTSPQARRLHSLTFFQAGIRFAQAHDLRVAIKSSGHDLLGRSTAKNSLLLWTAYFKNISFTEQFIVDGLDHGPAVTVGSGVGLKTIYAATKARGKMFVGGTAATISPAGGYIQGAGHSAFSPIYGLAADNVLRKCLNFAFSPTRLKRRSRVQRRSGQRVVRGC
jgi:FAD/FMN-containing dehydrogenase